MCRKFFRKLQEKIFTRPKLWQVFVIIFIVSFLILYFPLIYLGEKNPPSEVSTPQSSQKTPQISEKIPKENKLVISKLKVEAPIILMKWSKNATESQIQAIIQKYLEQGVGHYPGTALPGEVGNIFLAGHSSYYPWSKSKYKYVFSRLSELTASDKLIIYYNQKKYIYEVFSKKVVPPTDTSALAQGEDSILTLMTCTPVGTALNRLIVKARQISPPTSENTPRPSEEGVEKLYY